MTPAARQNQSPALALILDIGNRLRDYTKKRTADRNTRNPLRRFLNNSLLFEAQDRKLRDTFKTEAFALVMQPPRDYETGADNVPQIIVNVSEKPEMINNPLQPDWEIFVADLKNEKAIIVTKMPGRDIITCSMYDNIKTREQFELYVPRTREIPRTLAARPSVLHQ